MKQKSEHKVVVHKLVVNEGELKEVSAALKTAQMRSLLSSPLRQEIYSCFVP
jgi:hypothetical protein